MAIGILVFNVVVVLGPAYRAPVFVPTADHLNLGMVPYTAPADPLSVPEMDRAAFTGGEGRIFIEQWDPEYRALRVESGSQNRLRIRTFNFPGWEATVDSRPAAILTESETGLIALELPAGVHEIKLVYAGTSAQRTGSFITLAAFLALVGTILMPLWGRLRRLFQREAAGL
jgi:hypothetical protein